MAFRTSNNAAYIEAARRAQGAKQALKESEDMPIFTAGAASSVGSSGFNQTGSLGSFSQQVNQNPDYFYGNSGFLAKFNVGPGSQQPMA